MYDNVKIERGVLSVVIYAVIKIAEFNSYREKCSSALCKYADMIVLAADKRVTDPDAVLDIACDKNGNVADAFAYCDEIPEHKLCREVSLTDGSTVRLIDYASAGKTWQEDSRMAAWLRRK